jgi:hypothetical protein
MLARLLALGKLQLHFLSGFCLQGLPSSTLARRYGRHLCLPWTRISAGMKSVVLVYLLHVSGFQAISEGGVLDTVAEGAVSAAKHGMAAIGTVYLSLRDAASLDRLFAAGYMMAFAYCVSNLQVTDAAASALPKEFGAISVSATKFESEGTGDDGTPPAAAHIKADAVVNTSCLLFTVLHCTYRRYRA